MESTFTCFAHRNYQEHFRSNTSELFDFENSCEINGLLQGSLQALLSNVHHRDLTHLSNPSSVCLHAPCAAPPVSSGVAGKLSDAAGCVCGCLAAGRVAEGLRTPVERPSSIVGQ